MTFPYSFPFSFPATPPVTHLPTKLPIRGWWAEMSGTAHVTVTPTVTAHIAHLNLAGATVTPTVTATGFLTVSRAASVTVTPTVTAIGFLTELGTAAVTVTPTVSVAGHLAGQGPAAVTVTPTVTATGFLTVSGTAAATVTPTVTTSGALTYSGTAAVTVTPSVSATGSLVTVGFDAVGAGDAVASLTPSWAHTIGAGANACLVGFTVFTDQPSLTATVTCGGTSMTQLESYNYYLYAGAYYADIFVFGLANPPTGSKTIAVTLSGGSLFDFAGNSVSYNHVTGFGTPVTNNGTTNSLAISASSATGQMVFQVFGGFAANITGYNQTSRYNAPYNSGVNLATLLGDAAGASTVSFTASSSSSPAAFGAVAIPLL